MIHLDANYIIGLSNPDAKYNAFLEMLENGEKAETSAIAWHEFLCGPFLPLDLKRAHAILQGRILPINRYTAEFGAVLFNKTGRRRGSSADCMIAALAIQHSAALLTFNLQDFLPFVPFGLELP